MTDSDTRSPQVPDESTQHIVASPNQQAYPSHSPLEAPPFQTQLEHLSHTQQQSPVQHSQYGQQPFDMSAMLGALPSGVQPTMMPRSPYNNADVQMHQPQSAFRPLQPMQYGPQRNPQYLDPAAMARLQQQQAMAPQYSPGPSPIQTVPRQPGFQMPSQLPYVPMDPYGYGMNPAQFSPVDARFAGQPQFSPVTGRVPRDAGQFVRRASDTAPIPSFPRGPPRKPKQSGHALWVGNLPPAAQVIELKDHFSRDATNDIESVFLIAKSNCAFVNYRTEASCVAAMNRFHDSRFNGVRLVCRLRRGANSASNTPTIEDASEASPVAPGEKVEDSPTIARSPSAQSVQPREAITSDTKVTEKYFIVKSLTAQDLEASVRNGIWATQSHNEDALNRAFEQADNVYLIFSANKSGEYFGYARMASTISGEPVNLSTVPGNGDDSTADLSVIPQSIPTPATATAPKGRIIDDSARGTIFWEADRLDDEEGPLDQEPSGGRSAMVGGAGQNWGRQFQIEWLSTNRLPFFRTRGLRNPWNANREVKIARDGTELEPSVGRRLVSMFQRPSAGTSAIVNTTNVSTQ